MLISVIVPAYKKEKTIINDVSRVHDALSKTRWDFEIILVVDGFLDETFEEAKKLKEKNIRICGYEANRGKGYAIRYGMARSKGDVIAFIDAGMEINPNGISMLLEHMEWYDADIVVGSKRHPASKVSLTPMRKLYSTGYYLFVRSLFGLNVRDTQAGLKVFKRKVLEEVLPRLLVKRFAFDIELLAVARRLGFRKICEAPVELNLNFEDSSFKKNSLLFLDAGVRNMFWDTLAVFYRLYILRYYDDKSKRKWVYDKELDMRVNTGEMG